MATEVPFFKPLTGLLNKAHRLWVRRMFDAIPSSRKMKSPLVEVEFRLIDFWAKGAFRKEDRLLALEDHYLESGRRREHSLNAGYLGFLACRENGQFGCQKNAANTDKRLGGIAWSSRWIDLAKLTVYDSKTCFSWARCICLV
jgi:hypothetical protein